MRAGFRWGRRPHSECGGRMRKGRGGPFPFPNWPVLGRVERRVCLFAIPPEVDDAATAAKFRGADARNGRAVMEEWDAGARVSRRGMRFTPGGWGC